MRMVEIAGVISQAETALEASLEPSEYVES